MSDRFLQQGGATVRCHASAPPRVMAHRALWEQVGTGSSTGAAAAPAAAASAAMVEADASARGRRHAYRLGARRRLVRASREARVHKERAHEAAVQVAQLSGVWTPELDGERKRHAMWVAAAATGLQSAFRKRQAQRQLEVRQRLHGEERAAAAVAASEAAAVAACAAAAAQRAAAAAVARFESLCRLDSARNRERSLVDMAAEEADLGKADMQRLWAKEHAEKLEERRLEAEEARRQHAVRLAEQAQKAAEEAEAAADAKRGADAVKAKEAAAEAAAEEAQSGAAAPDEDEDEGAVIVKRRKRRCVIQ